MKPASASLLNPGTRPSAEGLRELNRRIERLGRVSDDKLQLRRTFLSPAMRAANVLVGEWMVEAGLKVHEDQVGNLIGRIESTHPRAKTLVLGSHLDTVRNAGRYDGALGVLLAISAVGELVRGGRTFPFAIEVVGFSEEEGVRFSSAYLGSKGYTATLKKTDLALQDTDGVSVIEAIEKTLGQAETTISPKKKASDLVGYFEVHIEQGPVLEKRNCALGVVTGIAGQTRARIVYIGKAGHAGTTPMALRADALAGAAEFILETEKLARATTGLVATVGAASVFPNAGNVIAGRAELSLDVRHVSDAKRKISLVKLKTMAMRIARTRKLKLSWEVRQDNAAVLCSKELSQLLKQSIAQVQDEVVELPSGAGHDAVILSEVAPVAMLFVRSKEGLSHHPDEYTSPADIELAYRTTIDFIERLAALP